MGALQQENGTFAGEGEEGEKVLFSTFLVSPIDLSFACAAAAP
jgi:hypothetical protein